jgi:hypothetical protein
MSVTLAPNRTTPPGLRTVAHPARDAHACARCATTLFVAGHVIGSILLAIGLRRSQRVGLAGCLILGISQPIHVLAAISGDHPLDLIGWGMTAVGMAFAARALITLPNDEWDLPPEQI